LLQNPETEAVENTILIRPIDRPLPIWVLVLSLAWPVLLQQLLNFSVILSDSFLAGHFQTLSPEEECEAIGHGFMGLGLLGGSGSSGIAGVLATQVPWEAARQITARHVASQAAQTTAHYLSWFTISYTIFVSVGSTALVARFIGSGDRRTANQVMHQSILLAAVLGVLGTVVGWYALSSLVQLLQLRGDAALQAVAYLRPLFIVLTFQIVEQAGIACLVGAGDTRTGFWILGIVALINVPLAWGFFHGFGPFPRYGFPGIALGTAISQTVGGTIVVIVLLAGRAGLRLRLGLLKPNWDLLWRLLRVSVPAAMDSMSGTLFQLAFLSLVNRLGDTASSAHGIALRWEAIGYLSGAAFGTAAMTLVGQNLGAGRPRDAARSGWVAFGLGCVTMCVMGAVFFTLAPEMFALFCPAPEQHAIIEAGVPVLRLVAFAMPPTASYIVFTFALRGAGDTRVPVIFTWIGFLGIRLPLTLVLTQDHINLGPFGIWPGWPIGLLGAWVAMFADLLIRGTFFLVRFSSGRWRSIRV
jgi:putative MATE family efflux protein